MVADRELLLTGTLKAFSPSLSPSGLTYDEVVSFVPPPLDQEEMES